MKNRIDIIRESILNVLTDRKAEHFFTRDRLAELIGKVLTIQNISELECIYTTIIPDIVRSNPKEKGNIYSNEVNNIGLSKEELNAVSGFLTKEQISDMTNYIKKYSNTKTKKETLRLVLEYMNGIGITGGKE